MKTELKRQCPNMMSNRNRFWHASNILPAALKSMAQVPKALQGFFKSARPLSKSNWQS
jgi:hypothetical protein